MTSKFVSLIKKEYHVRQSNSAFGVIRNFDVPISVCKLSHHLMSSKCLKNVFSTKQSKNMIKKCKEVFKGDFCYQLTTSKPLALRWAHRALPEEWSLNFRLCFLFASLCDTTLWTVAFPWSNSRIVNVHRRTPCPHFEPIPVRRLIFHFLCRGRKKLSGKYVRSFFFSGRLVTTTPPRKF